MIRIVADFSSNLAITIAEKENLLVTFTALKTELFTFHHRRLDPNYRQSRWKDIPSRSHRDLREYWAWNAHSTSKGTHISETSLKMHAKWSAPCNAPVGILYLITSRSGLKWVTAAIFCRKIPSPHFPGLIELKRVCKSLWEKNYPPPTSLTGKMWQDFHCFFATFMKSPRT